MLARRLALVVALVAALALVAILVTRGDGAIERSDEATDAIAHAPTAPHVDLAAAAPEQARTVATAPLDAQVESAAAQPTGRIFADLVRPRAHDEDVELADATIVCTTAEGVQRRVRIGDEVLESDLAPGGLWVVTAPDYLPGVVDPEYVAALPQDSKWLPHDVDLRPRARLTLRFEGDANDAAASKSLMLWIPEGIGAFEAWVVADIEVAESGPNSVRSVANDLLRLADGVDARADAAHHVARIRATSLGGELARRDDIFQMLWLPSIVDAPGGSSITFENVPAGEDLAIAAQGYAPLVFGCADGAPLAAFSGRGVVETAAFELERGEDREYFLRQVAPATVRGRLPPTTGPGADPSLWCEQPSVDGSRDRTAGRSCVPPMRGLDGSFEWAGLAPGHYRFYTSWEEAGNVHRFVRHEFDLAAGEVRDLGELQPPGDGRLTIEPMLVSAVPLAAGIEPSQFIVTLNVVGPLPSPQPTNEEVALASRQRITVGCDETCVVDGIESGIYQVVVHALDMRHDGSRRSARRASLAELFAALKGAADPRMYELTNPDRPIAIEVGEDTHLDFAIEVAAVGACTLSVQYASDGSDRPGETRFEFVRADGLDRQAGENRTFELAVDGVFHRSTTFVPPGEWLAIVANEGKERRGAPGVSRVALLTISVTSGTRTEHTVQLERAARLRVASDFDPDTTPRLADLGDREHVGVVLRPSASGNVFDGLLPNTRYRFGERVIETGPPGSEVVLE